MSTNDIPIVTSSASAEDVNPTLVVQLGLDPKQLAALRQAVEKRLKPLAEEVGLSKLLQRAGEQDVPIISGELMVRYRQLAPAHKELVRSVFPQGVDDVSTQAYCAYILVCGTAKLNAQDIPDPLRAEKTEERVPQLKRGVELILNLPEYVFWLVWFNFTWFQERCAAAFNEAALKNG